MDEKYCKCDKCKYPYDHLTTYHKCGKCGSYGHGFVECSLNNNGSYDKQNKLYESLFLRKQTLSQYKLMQLITALPSNKHCTISSCKTPHTHSTGSHHSLFSTDENGGSLGPDQYGIKNRYNEILKKGPEIIKNYNNSYIALYWGMGTTFVFRNKDMVIEKLETESDYSNFVKGLRKISE